jgi:hypothetical protein
MNLAPIVAQNRVAQFGRAIILDSTATLLVPSVRRPFRLFVRGGRFPGLKP